MSRSAAHRFLTYCLLAVVALAVTASGCSPETTTPPPDPEPAPPVVDPPGLYERGAGKVGAVGVFALMEGPESAWGVFGVADGQTAQSFVVASVQGAENLGVDLAVYRGRYVEVRGTLLEEDSATAGVPVLFAESIEVLVEDDPADPVP